MTLGAGGLGSTPLGGNAAGQNPLTSDPRYVVTAERRIFAIKANAYEVPTMQRFPAKYPGETRSLRVDFADTMVTGEALDGTTLAWSIESYADEGVDDTNTSSMLLGAPSIDGTNVVQRITGGVAGVTYKMTIIAGTDGNQTLIERATMKVVAV